ncbi:MAG: hypothetical protein P794_02380 [Epsilonproteobacteria bacterium (ex Lamellibrachia satsuma)]|nr:MAG: hypothetical protein P794_02380 [Epsilonproteobacteria bacterium (ex Lamellibrachia satsuma)]
MIKKNLTKLKNKKIKNFSFLTFAQLANYIIPLLVFPYLIRVIGIEKFGLIMFVLSVIQYLKIITEYGFSLIAAKEVAQNKANINSLSRIVSNVFGSKIILLLLSSFLLLLIT